MPAVAAATRARIQSVLAEVEFRPNMAARQLASKRSTTVGLVTFATNFYGPSQILVNSEQASKDLLSTRTIQPFLIERESAVRLATID